MRLPTFWSILPSKILSQEISDSRPKLAAQVDGETKNQKLGITENENELAKNGHSDRGARLLSKSLNLDSRKR